MYYIYYIHYILFIFVYLYIYLYSYIVILMFILYLNRKYSITHILSYNDLKKLFLFILFIFGMFIFIILFIYLLLYFSPVADPPSSPAFLEEQLPQGWNSSLLWEQGTELGPSLSWWERCSDDLSKEKFQLELLPGRSHRQSTTKRLNSMSGIPCPAKAVSL